MALASLSNSTTQKLLTQYYDDWYATSNTVGLTRGQEYDFHRVLFRPAVGVQARELIQLQTTLQAQLQHLSGVTLKYGQAVKDAQIAFPPGLISGRVLPSDNVAAFFDRTTGLGQGVYKSGDVTTKAAVQQFVAADEGIAPDNYLIMKYEGAARFEATDTIIAENNEQATFATGLDVFSPASTFSVGEGVFYLAGFFVRCRPQTIVLSVFTDAPSAVVGLSVVEEFLDELDDVVGESLLDPANQNAVGAHRLRLRLVLTSYALDAVLSPNFIQLATIINGVLQLNKVAQERYITLAELNQILARRTYDESGDYVLRPFVPVVDVEPTDTAKFRVTLGPGKAYVHGWEVTTMEPRHLALRKGRVTENVNNKSMSLEVGSHTAVVRVQARLPMDYFGNTGTVDIHSVNVSSFNLSSQSTYNRSRIGQTKIRMIETIQTPTDVSLLANNTVYDLFFYDTTFDTLTGNLASVGTLVNGAITFPIVAANGIPLVNNAIEGATIVLGGSASLVTGTCTVNNYVANASHGIVTLREFLPTLPDANTTWKLLFQPKDIDAFALYAGGTTALTPYAANLSFQAEVDIVRGKDGNQATSPTIIAGALQSGLVYELPNKFIVANTLTTATATWDTWVQTTANTLPMSGNDATVILSVVGTGLTLPAGVISADWAQDLLVFFDETSDADGHGHALAFADSTSTTGQFVSNVVITQAGSQYDIQFKYHHGSAGGGTRTFRGVARSTAVGLPIRTKTNHLGNTGQVFTSTTNALRNGQIEYHTLNATAGFSYNLKTYDAHNLVRVLYKSANTAFTTGDLGTATDVTSLFTLDDGQRDNSYEYARALCTRLASQTIKPEGRLLFIFDWFEHAGRGYATVDSYTNISYDEIPAYTSTRTGQSVNLRDVLDFRPARSIAGPLAASTFVYNSNTNIANTTGQWADTNTTYLTASADTYLIPAGEGHWLGDYEFYLGRIDQIAVNYDGTFTVIEGQDAGHPTPPVDDSGSLLLYRIDVPPYTLVDANGVPTSTMLTTFDYKRYTMQDISKVENRVAHLEYYTALNSLETITKDQSIADADGNERFKNGIVVDSFHGADVADVESEDYTASIDTRNRELRTAFRTFAMGFSPDVYSDITGSTTYGITLIGDMAIPHYSTTAFITQPYATHSISINPFNIASFYGVLSLNPAVDIWKDTASLPAQVIDMGGPTEAWVKAAMPAFVTWGEWEQTWSGVTNVETQRSWFTPEGWTPQNHGWRSMTELSWQDVETQTNYQRQGTAYEYTVQTTSQALGNRIVDTAIVHNCRARDVIFSTSGMQAGVNLYAFFDGINIDQYIQQGTTLQLEAMTLPGAPLVPGVLPAPALPIGRTLYVYKELTGNVDVGAGSALVSGIGTVFDFEVLPGQIMQITKAGSERYAAVTQVYSNTSLQLADVVGFTATGARICSVTPVTLLDASPRYNGDRVTYTITVGRAARDQNVDISVPYNSFTAGSLRPEKNVLDGSGVTGTPFITILMPGGSSGPAAYLKATSALCRSGVVRGYDRGAGTIRFDLDVTDDLIVDGVTTVRIVSGAGAGESTTVVAYTAANQTATLAGSLNAAAGQSIYSLGRLATDGFIDAANTAAIAGRAGRAAGVFHLPAGTFATGKRMFRLTDHANNVPADATTAAETAYEASGLAVTQQETTITSRSAVLQRTGSREESFSVTDHSVQNQQIAYVDPLAETFLVDGKQYPQGIFIASVDLWFAQVPASDIPVTVELRAVVNGYPSSSDIVPCCGGSGLAQVTLQTDQVAVAVTPSATDIATWTRFVFPALVHLLPGREYAIVVRSDSDRYYVFTAELGGTVVGTTDTKVSKQPYAGSLFKSQNASTWTESPYEDLMFRLNRCVWTGTADTPQTGILVGRAVPLSSNLSLDSVEFYPHDVQFADVTQGRYTLDIKPMNPTTGDLTSQIAVRYGAFPNEWRPLSVRSMVQGYGHPATDIGRPAINPASDVIGSANTVDLLANLTTWSTDVAPYLDIAKTNILGIQHLINDMGLYADDVMLTTPGAGYQVTLRPDTVGCTSGFANVVVSIGATVDLTLHLTAGDRVCLGGNLEVTVASVTNSSQFIATTVFGVSRTANTWYTYGGDLAGTNQTVPLTITSNAGTNAMGTAHINRQGSIDYVTFSDNGFGYTDTPIVTIPVPTPVGGFSGTLQANAVVTCLSELASKGGNGLTRYLTRPVTLADGFEARDIKVYFDAYRPLGSTFYVYYKVLAVNNEAERFEDQPWRLMTQITPATVVSSRWTQFKEFEFRTPNDRALANTTDTTDKFRVFAVKVLMASDNPVNAPRLTNFRAIALDN